MQDAEIPGTKPHYRELQKGRTYHWCSCGRSARQPLCDGSHAGTSFQPVPYRAEADGEEVLFCGCKRTSTPPFCDGTHNNLRGGYREDDPESAENRRIAFTSRDVGPRALLDGGCYVHRPDRASFDDDVALRYCTIIGAEFGAQHQSQHLLEATGGRSRWISAGASHGVLFVRSGNGHVRIHDRHLRVSAPAGVYLRPHESFALQADPGELLQVYFSCCPATQRLQLHDVADGRFDDAFPDRVVPVDGRCRTRMGERYFQMLVDRRVGSDVATQFIGHIPRSKAEPHRHLYEEALIIVSGEGVLWTRTLKAPVRPGDVVFLPRKQLHSLQSVSPAGMDVAGLIYPGDNPSINY